MNLRKIEMTDIFSDEAIAKLEVGQTLTFENKTGKDFFKIVKKKDGRIWSKKINMYKPEDFNVVDKVIKKPTKAKWLNNVKGKK